MQTFFRPGQEKFDKLPLPNADHLRIKVLVERASAKAGSATALAKLLEVTPQLVSNWKNGVKTPSPEVQADLAQIAGENVLITALMALIDKSEGTRKSRLQTAYRDWTKAQLMHVES